MQVACGPAHRQAWRHPQRSPLRGRPAVWWLASRRAAGRGAGLRWVTYRRGVRNVGWVPRLQPGC